MLFGFEQGLLKSPRYIPMFIRMKLALTGSFLSAMQWADLTPHEKSELMSLPGINAEDHLRFATRIQEISAEHPDESSVRPKFPESNRWTAPAPVDPAVLMRMEAEKQTPLPQQAWDDLSVLQRFTLMALAREPHLQEYLAPALQEFNAGK